MKGYWKAPVPAEMTGVDGYWIYLSFSDDSSGKVGFDMLATGDALGTESAICKRFDESYSWTTDNSSGTRTEFKCTSAIFGGEGATLTILGSTFKTKDDDTSKDTITMEWAVKGTRFEFVFERISEEPHEHTLSDNPSYTNFDLAPLYYHTTLTECEGDLHPQADYMLEHSYDDTSENPELCLVCGEEKLYEIEIGKGSDSSYSSCDDIYVTKSEGFTPGDIYTATGGTTYTGITKWVDYYSGVEYPMGEKIEPVEGMKLKFYWSEDSGTTGE